MQFLKLDSTILIVCAHFVYLRSSNMFFCCIFSLLLRRLFFLKEYVGDFAVNSIQWVKEKHHHEALCLADLLMLSLFSSDLCNLLKKRIKYLPFSFFHKIFLKCLHASRTQSKVFFKACFILTKFSVAKFEPRYFNLMVWIYLLSIYTDT